MAGNQILTRGLCIIIGYCFGLIQTAYIYGKMKGIDIRKCGSGNAGATNALRVLGSKAGIIVFAGDVIKTVLAILLVNLLVVPSIPGSKYLLILYTATGVILGHNFPFYLGFKGGKGIAATAGLIVCFHPFFYLPCLMAFALPFYITKYVSLGSLCVYLVFVIQMVVLGRAGLFHKYGSTDAEVTEMIILSLLLMAMAYYRHRTNIVKLIHGEETETRIFKKKE